MTNDNLLPFSEHKKITAAFDNDARRPTYSR
jgi:hypothetical protein